MRPILLLLSTTLAFLPGQAWGANKALALGWKGYADTDIHFSEFFGADYTISYRFLPQYPSGYEGPVVAENGTGNFFIGQGDFASGEDNTHVMVSAGPQTKMYQLGVKPVWHHLAVVAKVGGGQRTYTTYLDGFKLGDPGTLSIFNLWPDGTLRIGRRTDGVTINGREPQFYGLVDDLAVFTKALSQAEVQNLNLLKLTGNESGLLAGFTFDDGAQPAKLSRPLKLVNWGAKRVAVSEDHNSSDVSAIPLPFTASELTLPFKPGEAWYVIQGFDRGWALQPDGTYKEGSHNGYAAFCWDFSVAGYPQTGVYPWGTRFAPFYAAGRGAVTLVKQDSLPGPDSSANVISVKHAPQEFGEYLHLWPQSAQVAPFAQAERATTLLALAGNTGVTGDHLHFAITKIQAFSGSQQTIPSAFSNYELRDDSGEWHRVLRGIPARTEVVRNPVEPGNRYVAFWRHDPQEDSQHDEHMEFAKFEDFKAAYDRIFPQGWRLNSLTVNVVNGEPLYNATWRPDGGSETQVYGKTFADYKSKYDALSLQGWRLHILQSYVRSGQVLYNAVWRKDSVTEFPVYGLPYSSYRAAYDSMWPSGWRLHVLQSYVLNGQVLYNAVFRQKGGGSETQSYGIPLNALSVRNELLKSQGWRLSILQAYPVNGTTYYNAVWTPGTIDDSPVFEGDYGAFRAEYDKKRDDGWRLERLEVHHY